jgi:hypothetical protein
VTIVRELFDLQEALSVSGDRIALEIDHQIRCRTWHLPPSCDEFPLNKETMAFPEKDARGRFSLSTKIVPGAYCEVHYDVTEDQLDTNAGRRQFSSLHPSILSGILHSSMVAQMNICRVRTLTIFPPDFTR